MAVISLKNKTKSGSLLVGNTAFIPTDFESIATVTVGSGGSSTISFTSIPSTYKHLQVRIISRTDRANTYDNIKVNFNADTNANYNYHYLYGDGSAPGSTYGTSQNFIPLGYTTGDSATSGMFGASIIDILDYGNTNKYKTTRTLNGNDGNGSGYIWLSSGAWRDTAAINQIDLIPYTGTAFKQHSSFTLYGVKG